MAEIEQMRPRPGRPGAKPGNRNTVTDGLWINFGIRRDRRFHPYKDLDAVERMLSVQIGGNPSPGEALLIRRAGVLAFKCSVLEERIVSEATSEHQAAVPTRYDDDLYLRYVRQLASLLATLGLAWRDLKESSDLHAHLLTLSAEEETTPGTDDPRGDQPATESTEEANEAQEPPSQDSVQQESTEIEIKQQEEE